LWWRPPVACPNPVGEAGAITPGRHDCIVRADRPNSAFQSAAAYWPQASPAAAFSSGCGKPQKQKARLNATPDTSRLQSSNFN